MIPPGLAQAIMMQLQQSVGRGRHRHSKLILFSTGIELALDT